MLTYFQARAAAVKICFSVLVNGVERCVVQRGLGFTLFFPLFEQLFGRCVGVICVNNTLPPYLGLKSPELTFAYTCAHVRLFLTRYKFFRLLART